MTHPALIAFDMDGTLFASDRQVLPSSLACIRAALARGIRIALASGRDAWALRQLAAEAGLDAGRLAYFGLNGTVIVDGDGHQLWAAAIEPDLLAEVLAHARTLPVSATISAGPDLYAEDPDAFNLRAEAAHNHQTVRLVDRLDQAGVTAHKLLFSATPEVLADCWQELAAPFSGRLSFAFSAPTHFECTPLGVNKGAALGRYCELTGIDLADTVAFGDNENDLGMLRQAGLGVAMGNALDSVKAVADLVTADHDSDGIALVLGERFGLG